LLARSPAHRSARCAAPRFTPPLLRQWILGVWVLQCLGFTNNNAIDTQCFIILFCYDADWSGEAAEERNRRAAQRAERWRGGAEAAEE